MTKRLIADQAPSASLGATASSTGVEFALWAPRAQKVELCLFDELGTQEIARAEMHGPQAEGWQGIWHARLITAGEGTVYGYRVYGPWAPEEGHRFNPNKVLLDPYAQDVVGHYQGQPSFIGHQVDHLDQFSPVDNAADALKARVVMSMPPSQRARARVPEESTVLYEVHVRGATMHHPHIPIGLRGTYAGLGHPAMVEYLQRLGVTSLSLLPVQYRADEVRLQQIGLSNYWGYSPIAYFAPETRYWSGRPGTTPMGEFRAMVQSLHAAGLEVILDVVFNHTAETDEFGPTLSFRGIDNAAYYHLLPQDKRLYANWTGCGNVLNMSHPRVVQLVIDSLRHWVMVGGVDGFRFDLATSLCRDEQGQVGRSGLLTAIQCDPVLRNVKLIAEPWDIGPYGYQVGQFPAPWLEWNDQYRDTLRGFWLKGDVSRASLAHAVAGSSRLFQKVDRHGLSSVNLITAHDGFTLRDLVSYNEKHNLPNGEQNRDGHSHNLSNNCGVEGPTDDSAIMAQRLRLSRALLSMLMLSQGTPMLLAGDEMGHTQQGNNNAYCQDNDITWLQWMNADQQLMQFTQHLLRLRRHGVAWRQSVWATGQADDKGEVDWSWAGPDGQPLTPAQWDQPVSLPMQWRWGGVRGRVPVVVMINPTSDHCPFSLPATTWRGVLCSDQPQSWRDMPELPNHLQVPPHSVWVAVESTQEPKTFGATTTSPVFL